MLETQNRHYTDILHITLRYKEDDTNAIEDSRLFIEAMDTCFNVPTHEIVLDETMKRPVTSFEAKFLVAIRNKTKNDRQLVIFHYAGHSFVQDGELVLVQRTSTHVQKLSFEIVKNILLYTETRYEEGVSSQWDIITLLDCCYSSMATKPLPENRSVETFAACKEKNSTTQVRNPTSGPDIYR